MSNKYINRDVQVITLHDFHKTFLNPENITIQLDSTVKAKPYDFGALCFIDREPILPGWDSSKDIKPRKVMIESLQEIRRELILKVLDNLYISGNRDASIWTKLRYFQNFIEWCDSNGHSDFLKSKDKSVEAYKSFTDFIFHRIHTSQDLNAESANSLQKGAQFFLDIYYPQDCNEMKASTNTVEFARNSRAAPEVEDVDRYLATFVPIARNLRASVMNDDFPFVINCGEHEGIVLPCNKSISSPFHKSNLNFFDDENKRYLTEGEYLVFMEEMYREKGFSIAIPQWRKEHADVLDNIRIQNENHIDSYYRRIWAQKVIRCYAKLIQIITGASASEVTRLTIGKDLITVKDEIKKELVTVKFRAAGLKVRYSIHRKGLTLLEEYIQFRNWYLNGRTVDFLFFCDILSSGKLTDIKPLRSDFDSRLFKQLNGRLIHPSVKNIPPGLARKFKSVTLKYLGLSREKTAKALNHREYTNTNFYSQPSESQMKKELLSYWDVVKQSVSKMKIVDSNLEDVDSNIKSITVGHCDDFGNPESKIDSPSILPNCRRQYGCLYCERYVFHADNEDIHKIFCLRYVVNSVREFIPEYREADALFRDLCIRIESLIREVKERYSHLESKVDEIEYRVNELGILTPFWEERLARYEKIGVVL